MRQQAEGLAQDPEAGPSLSDTSGRVVSSWLHWLPQKGSGKGLLAGEGGAGLCGTGTGSRVLLVAGTAGCQACPDALLAPNPTQVSQDQAELINLLKAQEGFLT